MFWKDSIGQFTHSQSLARQWLHTCVTRRRARKMRALSPQSVGVKCLGQ